MQNFYEQGDGWNRESLCAFDAATITWRKVAARFNRGIQEPPERTARRTANDNAEALASMPAEVSSTPPPAAANAHRVTLRFEDGVEKEIEAGADEFVLDAALRQGVPLVYQCRSGSCSTCVGQMVSGTLEMARDRALSLIAAEIAEGKRLLCSSHALAPSVVRLHYPSALIYAEERRNFEARVASVEWPVPSVAKLAIALERRAGISFHAGQYVRIKVPGTEEWRSYSMCSTPRDLPKMEFLVRIIPGGVMSEYLRTARAKASGSKSKDRSAHSSFIRARGCTFSWPAARDSRRSSR